MNNSLGCSDLTTKKPCKLSLEINNDSFENAYVFLRLEINNCKNTCDFINTKISINNSLIKDELLSKLVHKEINIGNVDDNLSQELSIEYSLVKNAPDNLQNTSLNIEYFTGIQGIENDKHFIKETTVAHTEISTQSGSVSGVIQANDEPIHQNMTKYFNKELMILLICLIILFIIFVAKMFYTHKKCFEDSH